MDADLLVAELGSQGHYATPLIYVVNRAVSLERGGAPVRHIRVRLRGVAASQPLEGDCTAGAEGGGRGSGESGGAECGAWFRSHDLWVVSRVLPLLLTRAIETRLRRHGQHGR